MKYLALTLLCLVSVLTCQAQRLQHHELRVGDFTQVNVKHGVNVVYRSVPDSAGLVTFDAPPSMVNVIQFSCNGKGHLTITLQLDEEQQSPLPTVNIYSSRIEKVQNNGDSTLRVINPVTTDKFNARLEGNGLLSVTGLKCDEVSASVFAGRGQMALYGDVRKASLSVTGVGTVQADGLLAQFITATISGTGTIGCAPSEALTIQGTGPGTVYYTGSPMIKNRSIATKYKPL